jgi:hypothetical protein
MRRRVAVLALAICCGSAALGSRAQTTAADTPTFVGKAKVTDAINTDTGAIFDIGSGITMAFPRGLPVGRSRLVTLERVSGFPSKLIPKFVPLGPALRFNGAFNAAETPISLAVASKQDPSRPGMRLVLAMEIGTFCDDTNKAHKLAGGLCSGFELHEAGYDPAGKRLLVKLRSTGGLRLQFGLAPRAD